MLAIIDSFGNESQSMQQHHLYYISLFSASFQSTMSLMSRDTPMLPQHISPSSSSPIPSMMTAMTPSGSQVLISSPPKHPPPGRSKVAPLPPQPHFFSTMPSPRLSHHVSSPAFEHFRENENKEARRQKRSATEQPSLNIISGNLPIPSNYFAGTMGVEAQQYLRQESDIKEDATMMENDNIYAAPYSDGVAGNMTPSTSNSLLNTLINTSLPTGLNLEIDAIFNDDSEEGKYKSLNRHTMEDDSLYDDPSQVCADGEDDGITADGNVTVKIPPSKLEKPLNRAFQYARKLADSHGGAGSEVRVSVDGEYVLPNTVIRQPQDSSMHHREDSDLENSEYIVVT